ncbi:MAG: hypothetical protein KDN19_00705 [Verrucomicrobiae bacterium]|nr:hypothetical protein [Verrucomicrobiae bacterium]
MNPPHVNELMSLLAANPEAELAMQLPEGDFVPAHFHVTEIGRVQKDFIDCGGTVRSATHCQFQLLVASDVDHRLKAGKLAKILEMSQPLLNGEELPLVVEHEDGRTIAFPVIAIESSPERIEFQLALPHPACLAADKCGLAFEESGVGDLVFRPAPATAASSCCTPGGGCC